MAVNITILQGLLQRNASHSEENTAPQMPYTKHVLNTVLIGYFPISQKGNTYCSCQYLALP